jgi:hypothetical protein
MRIIAYKRIPVKSSQHRAALEPRTPRQIIGVQPYENTAAAEVAGILRSRIATSSLQLTDPKDDFLNRSQIVTGSQKHRDPRLLPWVFTEYGALMAANLLRSKQAVHMSLHVVRAFVRLREMVAANKELSKKLDELERRVSHHDEAITSIVKAIRELATPPEPKPKRRIGFVSDE